jgi:hypothetical protein
MRSVTAVVHFSRPLKQFDLFSCRGSTDPFFPQRVILLKGIAELFWITARQGDHFGDRGSALLLSLYQLVLCVTTP